MKRVFIMMLSAMMTLAMAGYSQEPKEPTLYDFTAKAQNGETVSLDKYKGKVVLVVNTASRCGFTPQYTDLPEGITNPGPGMFHMVSFNFAYRLKPVTYWLLKQHK